MILTIFLKRVPKQKPFLPQYQKLKSFETLEENVSFTMLYYTSVVSEVSIATLHCLVREITSLTVTNHTFNCVLLNNMPSNTYNKLRNRYLELKTNCVQKILGQTKLFGSNKSFESNKTIG